MTGLRGRLRGRFGILRGRRGKTVGLVKTRRLVAMQKQRRAIHLRQGYGGLKAGMKPPTGKFPRNMPEKGTKVSATWKRG